MLHLVPFIPALPFGGFLLLTLLGGRLSRRELTWIGVGSVGGSALLTALIAIPFLHGLPEAPSYSGRLWTWIDTAGLTAGMGWHLDALSLLMTLVITGVGFLIHLYSTEYMADDEGYRRFFAYMNLFVGSMLTLVLADNLLLLYLGWEGVGLCSYLLIGFWYRDPANGAAAQKAFIVTRTGDTALAVGLLLLFMELHTLSIQQAQTLAAGAWPIGSGIATAVAALLLAGAVGKSAQVPLQVWLPDAMAGPTPVSALIHAATMVTAGVYLIARLHGLFVLAPAVMGAVAIIGTVTLLLAGFSALVQRDIKRVLAYSTISQIGYMFLALGVGAWSAALFHFLTHACFKALLFLAAGAVILAVHHEQDIFRMGGLRRHSPVVFWTFLAGAAALSGLPLVTAGFYSKDWILWSVWSSPQGGRWLWAGGVLGAFLTALYSFRLVFRVFFGPRRAEPAWTPGRATRIPLVVLAALSLTVGLFEIPSTLGPVPLFSMYLSHALPLLHEPAAEDESSHEAAQQTVVTMASLAGVAVAAWMFLGRRRALETVASHPIAGAFARLWFDGWGFDRLYARLFVWPWHAVTREGTDGFDLLYDRLAGAVRSAHYWLTVTQTGQVRWYAASVALGALLMLVLAL